MTPADKLCIAVSRLIGFVQSADMLTGKDVNIAAWVPAVLNEADKCQKAVDEYHEEQTHAH